MHRDRRHCDLRYVHRNEATDQSSGNEGGGTHAHMHTCTNLDYALVALALHIHRIHREHAVVLPQPALVRGAG